MLMAAGAAPHMGESAHSSSSISPLPSWQTVLLVPNHNHHHHHQVLHVHDDLDLATPSPLPSPTTPSAAASPPCHNHLRPVSRRRAGKRQRRPRPSRKLPTTYISADAASFRRMVHQVTGADDAPLLHLTGGPAAASAPELLCRLAPVRPSHAGLTTTESETLLLPTLDTSAFLMLGAAAGGAGGAGRGGAAPSRPPSVSSCHGSSVVVTAVDPGAALQVKAEEDCVGAGGGFPSLESWDEDDALF